MKKNRNGSPLAPVRNSIEWSPANGDLLIPQFAHEDTLQFIVSMETPPQHLEPRVVRLTWVRIPGEGCLRMHRVMPDGIRHGEIRDDFGVPSGVFERCPCDYCNMVQPYVPIPDKAVLS